MSEATDNPLIQTWHIRLRHILSEYFDEGDLRALCFDLRLDYEDLAGDIKSQKAASLITELAQVGRINDLIDACSEARPNIPWDDLRTAALQNPLLVDEAPDIVTAANDRKNAGKGLPPWLLLVLLIGAALLLVGTGWWIFTAVTDTTLLFDDFEGEEAPDWIAIPAPNQPPLVTLPDGNRVLQIQEGVEALYAPAWEWDTTDYSWEADVMVADLNPETSIGLQVRIPSPNDVGYCQGYRAELGPGHTAVQRITTPDQTCDADWQFDSLAYGAFVLRADEWHHLRLDVRGNQLRFFVDDVLTLSATDAANTFPTGGIGIVVFSSEAAYVDDVVLTDLTMDQ